MPKPLLAVVVVFHNMRREARRTLYSLTTPYQLGVKVGEYEVIVLDSHSSEPLDSNWVESLQPNFRYRYVTSRHPTPCAAMNCGIALARAGSVVCMVDGARILSPGVLYGMIRILRMTPRALIQTIALHLGEEIQNLSLEKGYNQQVEDALLAGVPWEQNGYRLFDISSLAASSGNGFLHPLLESNCFCAPRTRLSELGGFDEAFTSPGGGLVNHDLLRRLLEDQSLEPFTLLGEASFHQFHGGVATNISMDRHPLAHFKAEYLKLRGEPFVPVNRPATLFGQVNRHSMRFVQRACRPIW